MQDGADSSLSALPVRNAEPCATQITRGTQADTGAPQRSSTIRMATADCMMRASAANCVPIAVWKFRRDTDRKSWRTAAGACAEHGCAQLSLGACCSYAFAASERSRSLGSTPWHIHSAVPSQTHATEPPGRRSLGAVVAVVRDEQHLAAAFTCKHIRRCRSLRSPLSRRCDCAVAGWATAILVFTSARRCISSAGQAGASDFRPHAPCSSVHVCTANQQQAEDDLHLLSQLYSQPELSTVSVVAAHFAFRRFPVATASATRAVD